MRARSLVVPGVAFLVLLHLLTRPGGSRPASASGGNSPAETAADWMDPYASSPWQNAASERTPTAPRGEAAPRTSADLDWFDDLLVLALEQSAGNGRQSLRNQAVITEGEDLFRRLDLNGDGVLDEEEMPTVLRVELGKWDSNYDRLIDLGEFLIYFNERVEQARPRAARSEPAIGPAPILARIGALDADYKGQITLYVWKEAGGSVSDFRKLDRNGDGFITREELKAARDEIYSTEQSAPLGVAATATGQGGETLYAVGATGSMGGAIGRLSSSRTAGATSADHVEARHISAAVAASTRPAPMQSAAASPAPRPVASGGTASVRKTKAAPAPAAPAPPPGPALSFTDASATQAFPLNTGVIPYWTSRNAQNDEQLQAHGHANVLFLGDSITDGLMTGRGQPVWDEFFVPLNSEDFAVAGATTSQVLWQVETGRVALASPDVVVLMIGTNNLAWGQSNQAVAAGITKIVDEIHAQLPGTHILLLGILPRGQSPLDPMRARVAQVNELIAPLENGQWLSYLDIGRNFLQSDGTISPTVMPDYLHPSLWGYDIYTAAIWEPLLELLGG